MASKRKRRRRGGEGQRKQGGALMSFRSGFQRAARAAAGDKAPARRTSWVGTAITVVLVVAAIALVARRFL